MTKIMNRHMQSLLLWRLIDQTEGARGVPIAPPRKPQAAAKAGLGWNLRAILFIIFDFHLKQVQVGP